MAISDAYATTEEYRSARFKSDAGDDGDLGPQLVAISRWLDRKLNRFFTRDDLPVARTYYPLSTTPRYRALDWAEQENPWTSGGFVRWLFTDDMSEPPTSVAIDQNASGVFTDPGDLVAATDYTLAPENANLGPEPKPFTALFVPGWSTIGGFQSGKRIQIVCRWGWPAIPEAIRMATIEFTAIWRAESPRATNVYQEMDRTVGVSKTANDLLKSLLENYAKKESLI